MGGCKIHATYIKFIGILEMKEPTKNPASKCEVHCNLVAFLKIDLINLFSTVFVKTLPY